MGRGMSARVWSASLALSLECACGGCGDKPRPEDAREEVPAAIEDMKALMKSQTKERRTTGRVQTGGPRAGGTSNGP